MPDRDHSSHGRFRYGPWRGGPDPLAPPYDVRAALDEVGRDVLAGGSLGEALRELLRRGMDGRRRPGRAGRAGPPDAPAGPPPRRPRRHPGPRPRRPRPGPGRRAGHPRRPGRRRRPAGRDGAGHPAGRHRGAGAGAGRLRLAVARGPRDVRVDPGHAAQRGARRAVRRAQAGAAAPATRRRCRPCATCSPTSTRCWPRTPAGRTRPTSSTSSWTSTATCSPSSRRTSTS